MTDVTQYKPGDVITLEQVDPEGRIIGRIVRVVQEGPSPAHPIATNGIESALVAVLVAAGWTVTKHEPAVQLPTEPGWYQVVTEKAITTIVYRNENSGWYWPEHGEWREPLSTDRLTLLRPVDEVRRETLTAVLKNLDEADIAPHHVVRWLRDYRFELVSE